MFESKSGVLPIVSPWMNPAGTPLGVDRVQRQGHRRLDHRVLGQAAPGARVGGADQLLADVALEHRPADVVGVVVEDARVAVLEVGVEADALAL